jgi:hypothetical protein
MKTLMQNATKNNGDARASDRSALAEMKSILTSRFYLALENNPKLALIVSVDNRLFFDDFNVSA